MEIAFRKNNTSFIGKLICWWTKSPYSHCELIFRNGNTFSADVDVFKTRFKSVTHDEADWDFIELPFDTETEAKVFEWCLSENDCYYDMIGIMFTQVIPISFENPWWWFCSENCCAAVQQGGLLNDLASHEIAPGKLYKILKERLTN